MNTHRTRRCSLTFGFVVIAVMSAIVLAASATAMPASAAGGHPTEADPILPDHLVYGDGGDVLGAAVLPDHLAYADDEVLGGSVLPDHLVHGGGRDVSAEWLWPDHLVQGDGSEVSGGSVWPDHLVSSPRNVARLGR